MVPEGWGDFLTLCLETKETKLLSELLHLLLTAEERESLGTRCLIIEALLAHEVPQRQMSKELKVSIAKITRGSNELKTISPKLRHFLKKHFRLIE